VTSSEFEARVRGMEGAGVKSLASHVKHRISFGVLLVFDFSRDKFVCIFFCVYNG